MRYNTKKLYKSIEDSNIGNDIYAMPKNYYDFASENELVYTSSDKHRNGYEFVFIHSVDDSIYWLSDEDFHKKYKLV